MNRRVIAKILKHKHDDFLKSITDLEVRKLIDDLVSIIDKIFG